MTRAKIEDLYPVKRITVTRVVEDIPETATMNERDAIGRETKKALMVDLANEINSYANVCCHSPFMGKYVVSASVILVPHENLKGAAFE